MNSYQKLKAENDALKEDIYNLIKHKDEAKGIEVLLRYNAKFDFEKAVWQGNEKINICGNFNGILSQCKK